MLWKETFSNQLCKFCIYTQCVCVGGGGCFMCLFKYSCLCTRHWPVAGSWWAEYRSERRWGPMCGLPRRGPQVNVWHTPHGVYVFSYVSICTIIYVYKCMYMCVYVFMYIMYIYQFVHNIGLSPNHDESSIMYHRSSIYVDFISKRMLLLVYSQFEIVYTRLFIATKKKKKKNVYCGFMGASGGGLGVRPPPFGPRYRLFNIGPKIGPPSWTPLFCL